MRNNFPFMSIIFENGNENCYEVRNVMLEVVGKMWEVKIFKIFQLNIRLVRKKNPALFYASRYFSWDCYLVLRAGWVCPGMFSLWEPDIRGVITSSSLPGQRSLPLLLSRIFLKTLRFLTANKGRALQRRAPTVSIQLSKT